MRPQIAGSSSTALKGIPPRVAEALDEAPLVEEPIQDNNGDDSSVFPDWLAQLGSVVGGFDDLKTCNPAGEQGQEIQLPANSIVSCRLAPTGETILSFQWRQVSKTSSNCSC